MQVVVRQDTLREISSRFQNSSETEFRKGSHVLGIAIPFPSVRMPKFYLPLILYLLFLKQLIHHEKEKATNTALLVQE